MNNLRRGWCPSLFRPMQTGDGWLCRIKPFYARLTSSQAFFIAQAARQYGNGFINLTQRGNLQLRGFTEQAFHEFIPSAIQHHLCSPTQKQENKRNFLIPPLGNLDKTLHPETQEIIRILEKNLIEKDIILFPSGKFDLLIDGRGSFSFDQETADINIRTIQGKWFIQLGNSSILLPCTTRNIAFLIQDILHFCHTHQIKRLIHQENANAYLKQTPYPTETHDLPSHPPPAIGAFSLGFHLAIPFGLLTGQQLHTLARLSEHHGNSEIHLTPWRSVILPGYSGGTSLSHLDDFITDPTDPRLTITLCPGKPYCMQGQQPILNDVRQILPLIRPLNGTIHVSGCAKGCASPKKHSITLCATAKGYTLIMNGKPDSSSHYQDLPLTEIMGLLNTINKPSQ